MTGILVLEIDELGIRITGFDDRNDIIFRFAQIVDLGEDGDQIIIQSGRVHITRIQHGHIRNSAPHSLFPIKLIQ